MVLHSVTLWTGAWESGSGWGLGVPKFPLMVLQNGTFEWHFVTHSRSLCVTRPKTYLLWFWLPPSFPIRSITLPFSLRFLSATLSLCSLFVTHFKYTTLTTIIIYNPIICMYLLFKSVTL